MKTIVEILHGAIKHLENHEWVQEAYVKEDGSACLVGAIRVAGGVVTETGGSVSDVAHRSWMVKVHAAYMAVECVSETLNGRSVENWNDKKGRTKEQVIDALRETADRLEFSENSNGEGAIH